MKAGDVLTNGHIATEAEAKEYNRYWNWITRNGRKPSETELNEAHRLYLIIITPETTGDINETDKTARDIKKRLDTKFKDGSINLYNLNIVTASSLLCKAGHTNATYQTQWASGNSSWLLGDNITHATVDIKTGKINL